MSETHNPRARLFGQGLLSHSLTQPTPMASTRSSVWGSSAAIGTSVHSNHSVAGSSSRRTANRDRRKKKSSTHDSQRSDFSEGHNPSVETYMHEKRTQVPSYSCGLEDIDEEEEEDGTFTYLPLTPRYEVLRSLHQAQILRDPSWMAPATALNRLFLTKHASKRFRVIKDRKFVEQKLLCMEDPDFLEVKEILRKCGLLYTVLDVRPYAPQVIHEFYSNLLHLDFRDGINLVYVRGKMFNFSPAVINELFETQDHSAHEPWTNEDVDEAVVTVTGGKKKKWGRVSMVDLTKTMNLMFKFTCANWMPTSNKSTLTKDRIRFIHMLCQGRPFNFGKMVFDQILEVAASPEDHNLLFPNLIGQLLDSQHEHVTAEADSLSNVPLYMVLDGKQGMARKAVPEKPLTLAEDLTEFRLLTKRINKRLARKFLFCTFYGFTINVD